MTDTAYHRIRTTAHGAPAGCPVDHAFTPLGDDYVADPYPIANALRERSPVVYAEPLGFVVVTEMDLVTEVFMNPGRVLGGERADPVFPISAEAAAVLGAPDFDPVAVMSNRPEPDHGRIRNYTKLLFSNRRIQGLEPYIRRRAHELIDVMLAGPRRPTSWQRSRTRSRRGGVPVHRVPRGGRPAAEGLVRQPAVVLVGQADTRRAGGIADKMLAYWRYVRAFVARQGAQPGDDLASELIGYHLEHPDDLSYREVESILYGLSFAGHEPVTLLLGNSLLSLLPRRDAWAEVCDDPR